MAFIYSLKMNKAIPLLILGIATLINATPVLKTKPLLKQMREKVLPMWDAPQGTLIVGGEEATPHEFPWIVSIRIANGHNCGGSLVTSEWVVTAAHCVESAPRAYNLVAGDHNINEISGREQRRQVVTVIRHENYNRPIAIANDIALLKVSPPLVINQYVSPANLPEPDYQPTANATVSGWGRLYGGGPIPSVLQKVDLPHVNDSLCRSIYPGQIADSMVCYGGGADKSSCHGDSGGPLIGGPNNTLIGIVSWGSSQCAQQGRPNVYTRVTSYVDWIRPRITLQPEDASPVANVTSCGAHVDSSSGLVSLQNLTSSCIITLETLKEGLRVRLLQSSLVDGDVILATQIVGGEPANSIEISGIGRNHTLRGGLVLLTIALNPNVPFSNRSLQLEYYSSGYAAATYLTGLYNLRSGSSLGNFSYPIGGGNYQNNENVLITLGGAKSLNFTRMDLEGSSYPNCPFDSVTVLALRGAQYVQVARTCDTNIPSPINLPDGVALINFVSDPSITATGFTINYS